MNITVTPRASDELKKATEARRQEQDSAAVRVMVQSRCGCGSAHFAMGFDDQEEGDNTIDLGGITLLVDPDSAPFLDNAEMDYSDDLMGRASRSTLPAPAVVAAVVVVAAAVAATLTDPSTATLIP